MNEPIQFIWTYHLKQTCYCRSAEYDEALKICRLSREDRRTQPSAFRKQPGLAVDYLENQCVKRKTDYRQCIMYNRCVCGKV